MQIDTTLGDLASAAADARSAESAGYAGAFTGEVSSDPFLPLALAAEATTALELGTSIAVAFARSPMTLAYTAYDLQRFSQGRFILGLGAQIKAHITRRFSMPWSQPAARMREYVLAMRAAWEAWDNGSPLHFDGEFYQHTLMPPMFMPTPHEYGAPPVFVAGVGDAMTRIAGEVADGFLAHAFTTERWLRERTVPALTEGRRSAGKTLDGFTVKAAVFLVTGSDEEIEEGSAAVRSQLAFYASTPAYKPVLDLHGWGAVGEELTRLSKAGQWEQMSELIDDDMLQAFAIVAPLDEVRDRVQARCAGAIDRVSFLTAAPQQLVLDALRS
jgi:probable F420-dependent oxidoreductase